MEEDKEVAKAETLTKAGSKIKRFMTQKDAHMEEENFEEGRVKEDEKIIKGMMHIIVVARIVADQTTLQGIDHIQIKEIDNKTITMHLLIIRMI